MSEPSAVAMRAADAVYEYEFGTVMRWREEEVEAARIIDRETKLPLLLATLETIAVLDPEEQDMRELQRFVREVLTKVKGEELDA